MDKREVTLLVLLDLSATFDTVDHNILINILESDFGICADVLKWFRSYLTGRVQRVIVNQQSSETIILNYDVPQGSCLGPVLFLLYASRLFEVVKKHLPSVPGTPMILSYTCRFVQIRLLFKIKRLRLLRTA